MDKIILALLIIAVILLAYGIYVLLYPGRYQNNGTTCEKITMSTCTSIKNDYYIFGVVMIITAILIGGLSLFELFGK